MGCRTTTCKECHRHSFFIPIKIGLQGPSRLRKQLLIMNIPPIDPMLSHCLQRFAQLDAETVTPGLNYVQRRRLMSELQARLLRTRALPHIAVQNHYITAAGQEIAVRSYAPTQHDSGQTLLWLHGGG